MDNVILSFRWLSHHGLSYFTMLYVSICIAFGVILFLF